MKLMKTAVFSIVGLLALAFLVTTINPGCRSKAKRIKADTAVVSIIFQDQYHNDNVTGANAIRFIRDSIDNSDDQVKHIPDTLYYVPITYGVSDPKDSTLKTILKGKDGKDSTRSAYYPVVPRYKVLQDYNNRTPITLSQPQPTSQPITQPHSRPITNK
jgi:hypothetical protein